jgi:hypothetical protein
MSGKPGGYVGQAVLDWGCFFPSLKNSRAAICVRGTDNAGRNTFFEDEDD